MAFSKEQHDFYIEATTQYFDRGKLFGAQDERKRCISICEQWADDYSKQAKELEKIGKTSKAAALLLQQATCLHIANAIETE